MLSTPEDAACPCCIDPLPFLAPAIHVAERDEAALIAWLVLPDSFAPASLLASSTWESVSDDVPLMRLPMRVLFCTWLI